MSLIFICPIDAGQSDDKYNDLNDLTKELGPREISAGESTTLK
jgi:hypothetical protein